MKKLNKILKFSAFTLLCTSSLMAAVGDNMSAGLGVNIGNDVQQQTYLDNYTTDHGNGPLVGIDFQTQFKMMDTGSAVAMLDLRNVYYQKVKTDTLGVGFVYRLKNSSTFGQGFHIAYDYTWYDDLDFQQVAMGHEANFQGFDTRLNFYVPFGSNQHYTNNGVEYGGSNLTGLYGVDLTLAKKISDVELNAGVTYNFHDDVADNITALNLGGEYKMSTMLMAGAKYQFRNGLDSSDHGYKVYAKVPLFRGAQDAGSDRRLSAPVKRQLGATIQFKEEQYCKDLGFDTIAAYGITWCTDGPAAFAAEIKSGAGVTLHSAASSKLPANTNWIFSSPHKFSALELDQGVNLVFQNDGTIITEKFDVSGVVGNPVQVHGSTEFKTVAKLARIPGMTAVARKMPSRNPDAEQTSLIQRVFISSANQGLSSVSTVETADRATNPRADSGYFNRTDMTGFRLTGVSTVSNQQATFSGATSTNEIVASLPNAGYGSTGTAQAAGLLVGSNVNYLTSTRPILSISSDIIIRNSNFIIDAPMAHHGGTAMIVSSNFSARAGFTPQLIETGHGNTMYFYNNLVDTTNLPDGTYDSSYKIFYKDNDATEAVGGPTDEATWVNSGSTAVSDCVFSLGRHATDVFNAGAQNGKANHGRNLHFYNSSIFSEGGYKERDGNSNIAHHSVYGVPVDAPTAFGKRATASSASDIKMFANRIFMEEILPEANVLAADDRLSKTIGGGREPQHYINRLNGAGRDDNTTVAFGSTNVNSPNGFVMSSQATGTQATPKTVDSSGTYGDATTNVGFGFDSTNGATDDGLRGFGYIAAATDLYSASYGVKSTSITDSNAVGRAAGIANAALAGTPSGSATAAGAGTTSSQPALENSSLPNSFSQFALKNIQLLDPDTGGITYRTDAQISANKHDSFASRVATVAAFTKMNTAAVNYVTGTSFGTTVHDSVTAAANSTVPGTTAAGTYGNFDVNTPSSLEHVALVNSTKYSTAAKTGLTTTDSSWVAALKAAKSNYS